MMNIKNKFIVFVVWIIFLIVLFQVFLSPTVARDTNSYLSLVKGQCLLNNEQIVEKQKYALKEGDAIETKKDSIAVIEWGDGSITRISEDTQILLKKTVVSQDIWTIQLAFSLVKWKSWSKVTSLIAGDSYFKEYIDDLEAWVRGTEFEVNKDKWYLSVVDHEVQVTSTNWKTISVWENQALSLPSFSIIEIEKFVSEMKDVAWEEVNQQLDNDMIASLKKDYEKAIESQIVERLYALFSAKHKTLAAIKTQSDIDAVSKKIEGLSESDRLFLKEKVLTLYQSIHFAEVWSDMYKDKVYFRKILLMLSNDSDEKDAITKSQWYDVQDMVQMKNFDFFNDVMGDMKLNTDSIKNLNINIEWLFWSWVTLPEGAMKALDDLKASIKIPSIGEFGTDDIKGAIEDKAKGVLEDVQTVSNQFKK